MDDLDKYLSGLTAIQQSVGRLSNRACLLSRQHLAARGEDSGPRSSSYGYSALTHWLACRNRVFGSF